MIGFLEGRVRWKTEDKIIVKCGGTGYLVHICHPQKISDTGEMVELFVYTYVRDDAIDLYGFLTMKERELFSTLLSVSRVGPRAGMNILSTLNYDQFVKAILTEEINVLKQVSGVGPKTARRLILELQGKIEELGERYGASVDQTAGQELFQALTGLGYTREEVSGAVEELDFPEVISLEEKIKRVLSYLGKESF